MKYISYVAIRRFSVLLIIAIGNPDENIEPFKCLNWCAMAISSKTIAMAALHCVGIYLHSVVLSMRTNKSFGSLFADCVLIWRYIYSC